MMELLIRAFSVVAFVFYVVALVRARNKPPDWSPRVGKCGTFLGPSIETAIAQERALALSPQRSSSRSRLSARLSSVLIVHNETDQSGVNGEVFAAWLATPPTQDRVLAA